MAIKDLDKIAWGEKKEGDKRTVRVKNALTFLV